MANKRAAGDAGGARKKKRSGGGKYMLKEQNIEPGWSGIFVTCIRGREKQCEREMQELFKETLVDMYGTDSVDSGLEGEDQSEEEGEEEVEDIEKQLQKEVDQMKSAGAANKTAKLLLSPIDVNCECLLFFRARSPVDPVSICLKLCQNAKSTGEKRTRYCQRLTPITKTDAATAVGLKRLAPIVLKPEFHADEDQKPVKFAIKTTCRNHSVLSRDEIIKAVAESVGRDHGHKVDLKNYDKLILVEAYKGSIGMSIVDPVYDDLEKFNLGRLQDLATKSVKGARSYINKESSEKTENPVESENQSSKLTNQEE